MYKRAKEKNIESEIVNLNLVEENFILKCSNNNYAMEFVRKYIEENEVRLSPDMFAKYNTGYLTVNGYNRLENILEIIAFLQYCEENLELLRSLCLKSIKKIYKHIESNNELPEEFIYDNDVTILSLFVISFLDKDVSMLSNNDYMEFYETEAIIEADYSNFVVSDSVSRDLRERYSKMLSAFGIKKAEITIKKIIDNLNDFTLEYLIEKENAFCISDFRDIERFDNIINSQLQKRIKTLAKRDFIDEKDSLLFATSYIINFNTYAFSNTRNIEEVCLSKEDIDAVLFTLDTIKDRTYHCKNDIIVFIDILMARAANKVINILTESACKNSVQSVNSNNKHYNITQEKDFIINELKDDIDSLSSRNSALEDENKRLRQELANLKAKNSKLLDKHDKSLNNKKELESLRAFVFSLSSPEEFNNEDILLEEISLDGQRIAFIGADEVLHSKIKNKIGGLVYVTADEVNKDLKFLRNMNKIVIHTHMNHGLYYKVMETIRNYDIDIIHINAVNIDLIMRSLSSFIKK